MLLMCPRELIFFTWIEYLHLLARNWIICTVVAMSCDRELLYLYSTLCQWALQQSTCNLLAKGAKKHPLVGFLIHMHTTQLTATSGVYTSTHLTIITFLDSKPWTRQGWGGW